jgi:hypothetical protein
MRSPRRQRYAAWVRVRVTIEDAVYQELKAAAAASGRTLAEIVDSTLREGLARTHAARNRPQIELPVSRGGRMRPGVDISNSAELLDIMEGLESPS